MTETEKIPSAKLSPRIENGVFYFYENDTFKVLLSLDIKMRDGSAYPITGNDNIVLSVYGEDGEFVGSYTFNHSFENETITEVNDLPTTGEADTLYWLKNQRTLNAYENNQWVVVDENYLPEDKKITIVVKSTNSAKLSKGRYIYKIVLNSEYKSTLVDENKIIVE